MLHYLIDSIQSLNSKVCRILISFISYYKYFNFPIWKPFISSSFVCKRTQLLLTQAFI